MSVTVRGEIILKLSDMKKAFPGAANPRNQASGTSKRFDGAGCEHLTVLFYDLDGEDHDRRVARSSSGSTALGLDRAEQHGDRPRRRDRAPPGLREDQARQARLRDRRPRRPRERRPRRSTCSASSATGRAPRSPSSSRRRPRSRRCVDIIWDTGSSGRVTPVAIVEPVELAGATVQRASLHNASNVAELGIGIGDEVLVSRRNDVIPYVEEVVDQEGQAGEAADEVPASASRRSRRSASTSRAATASAPRSSRAASRTGSTRSACSSGARS